MKLKTLNLTILLVTILVLFPTIQITYGFSGSFSSIPIYITPPVGDYSYLIDTNGTYTIAKNGTTGEIEFGSTSFSSVSNWANGNLTSGRNWYETIVYKGNFTVDYDTPMYIYNWTEWRCYQAQFHKQSVPTSTTPIVKGEYVEKIRIWGGYFEGGSDRGNTGDDVNQKGIDIDNNAVDMPSYSYTVELFDVTVDATYGTSFYIQLSSADAMVIVRCQSKRTTRRGYDLCGGDSKIVDSNANTYYENLYLNGGRFAVSNFYAGGTCSSASPTDSAIYLNGSKRCKFVNVDLDYTFSNGIIVNGGKDHQFVNVRLVTKNNTDLNNTYSGFKFINSVDNTIDACSVVLWDDAGTWFLKYGVEETGTSDFNMISDCNFRDVGTAGIITVGANTKVSHCWNGTSWIS